LILVTGGAGFIGSNFVLDWLAAEGAPVLNFDVLTYAGNPQNLAPVKDDSRHVFVRGDIADRAQIAALLQTRRPRAVVHFAAESHVDRSIRGPAQFVHTNVVGTFALLEEARAYWSALGQPQQERFRFVHVSTDEVYGSLGPGDAAFSERTAYAPNSPYAASKAGADHLVRAWHHTYGLPTVTINCSNNYGPRQFPEKLIPLTVLNAHDAKPIPVYGDGRNVRDWLYVGDHCDAIRLALERGRPGETYNVGARAERANIDVVMAICAIMDELRPEGAPHSKLVSFVKDRPGHDRRYAIDPGKIERELGWRPRQDFESGLRKTVEWYLANMAWVKAVTSGEYRRWIETHYGEQHTP
jgi:dTDP-glucose 4,6-dehydratase